MSDFLGGMNPGFPASLVNTIEPAATVNRVTNESIRASARVLKDGQALTQQANSDAFNNQTEGAVPIAQNDIEPPKADDYQRLAQRMGSGPVIDARLSETRALNPFVPISSIPFDSLFFRCGNTISTNLSAPIPSDTSYIAVTALNGLFIISPSVLADDMSAAAPNRVVSQRGTVVGGSTGRLYFDASGLSSITVTPVASGTLCVELFK